MMALLRWPLGVVRLFLLSLVLALSQIRANKLRSLLTTIGIVIGVASVTTVIAALTGLQQNVLSEFETFGTKKIFIEPNWPQEGRLKGASWRTIRFYPDQFDGMLEHCPSIEAFTRICQFQETLRRGGQSLEQVAIMGVEASWHAIENRLPVLGRPISAIDGELRRRVCLIGEDVREKLRLDEDCIGETIYIGQRLFQIIGILEPRANAGMFGGRRGGSEVFIPFETAWNLAQPWMSVVAASKSTGLAQDAKAELSFFLRRTRRLQVGDPDTFQVHVVEQFVEQFNQVAATITMVAGGIVGISLLVGGIGIMNIMLVSVSERTREIGLRKAVGARPSAILLQFLVEAVVLCCVGGALGLAMAQLMTWGMGRIPEAQLDKATIPLWAIAMAFGFSVMVGLIFGIFPALKAARLDPIEALRHE